MEFNFKVNQPKTWFIDLDGTIVRHNGYKTGKDILLPNVEKFFCKLNKNDYIVITTARSSQYKKETINFLKENGIRYNQIIFDLPMGERVLINDKKEDGTITAYCVNLNRDAGF